MMVVVIKAHLSSPFQLSISLKLDLLHKHPECLISPVYNLWCSCFIVSTQWGAVYWYNMGSRKLIKFVHSKLSADDRVCVCVCVSVRVSVCTDKCASVFLWHGHCVKNRIHQNLKSFVFIELVNPCKALFPSQRWVFLTKKSEKKGWQKGLLIDCAS